MLKFLSYRAVACVLNYTFYIHGQGFTCCKHNSSSSHRNTEQYNFFSTILIYKLIYPAYNIVFFELSHSNFLALAQTEASQIGHKYIVTHFKEFSAITGHIICAAVIPMDANNPFIGYQLFIFNKYSMKEKTVVRCNIYVFFIAFLSVTIRSRQEESL